MAMGQPLRQHSSQWAMVMKSAVFKGIQVYLLALAFLCFVYWFRGDAWAPFRPPTYILLIPIFAAVVAGVSALKRSKG